MTSGLVSSSMVKIKNLVHPVFMSNKTLAEKRIFVIELLVTLLFCFIPLLFKNPYRLNIFLSWEGAYRLSIGQIPFKDFALPMGFGYWVIPALFFKLFGPFMYSLIKAQVFINLVSVLTFRGILRKLNVDAITIFLSVVIFCFSYVSWNFWPWYNHLVIVLGFLSMYFALSAVFEETRWKSYAALGLAAFFILFAFFTKQDGGALSLLIVYGIVIYDALVARSARKVLVFTGFMALMTALFVLPFIKYDFLYWFNYGQAPHDSRIHVVNFLNEIMGWSYWQKFFLLVIALVSYDKYRRGGVGFLTTRKEFLFAYVTAAIMVKSMIIQVTSHEPPNGEVFFYAFGFAYCFSHLRVAINFDWRFISLATVLVFFWWSGIYWRNIQRVISKKPVVLEKAKNRTSHEYRLATEFKTMDRLFLAESTIEGIKKIKAMEEFRNPGVKVLNMSELTSLAYEIPFTPLTNQPMWFHQGVSIFQKQVDEFCERVSNYEYDVVLFETIPTNEVINFYPADVKACLDEKYKLEFTFLAPRTPEESFIYVYRKPKPQLTSVE